MPRFTLIGQRPAVCDDALALLDRAADAAVDGDFEATRRLAVAADLEELARWAFWARDTTARLADVGLDRRSLAAPAGLRIEASSNISARAKVELGDRDGWRCRFCQCRVLAPDAVGRLKALVPELRWGGSGRRDSERHGGIFAHHFSHDHVLPATWGGSNQLDNLVTACWPCQFSRMDYRLDDCGITDPFTRPPVVDEWDGLRRIRHARIER